MKRTKTKVDIKQFHNDVNNLSDKDFKKRYPGVNREAMRGLSDNEIEKVAGGVLSFTPTFGKLSSYGTSDGSGIGPKIVG